jgi:uncharacterized phiE125 gp8 family phage protein
MELSVTSLSITEPVTNTQVKSFMGYPLADTNQDTTIDTMITTARQWLESRTSLSLVSKDYKTYFEPDDSDEGWYELPVSPVTTTPVVKVNDVVTTFQQKGLKTIYIQPDAQFSTIPVGSSSPISYTTAEFTAGATNGTANQLIIELAAFNFNHRDDGVGLSFSRLPFDLKNRIESISMNF